jgi:DNA-directed RNA polymerase subunit F
MPLENFADIQSPLTNYIKKLKKSTPEQAYELKSKLQGMLRDFANRLDNFDEEQSHNIVKKLIVILSNIDEMLNKAEPNITNISKLLPELYSGINMIMSQNPKSE